jgi:hypothetical protein
VESLRSQPSLSYSRISLHLMEPEMFITMLTRSRHGSLSRVRLIQSIPPPSYLSKIHFNIILLINFRSGLFLSDYPTKNFTYLSFLPCVLQVLSTFKTIHYYCRALLQQRDIGRLGGQLVKPSINITSGWNLM